MRDYYAQTQGNKYEDTNETINHYLSKAWIETISLAPWVLPIENRLFNKPKILISEGEQKEQNIKFNYTTNGLASFIPLQFPIVFRMNLHFRSFGKHSTFSNSRKAHDSLIKCCRQSNYLSKNCQLENVFNFSFRKRGICTVWYQQHEK